MKAMLVIDLPDYLDEHDIPELLCNIKVIQDDEYIFSRHFLKLKPLPQKNKYDVEKYATVDYENEETLGHYLNIGWNACIDEILGEIE